MNSKFLILSAFTLWCFVCVRWYVCGIKEVCAEPLAVEETIHTGEYQPDAAADTVAVQPQEAPPPPDPNLVSTKPVTPENMGAVQMEKVEDHMVIHFPYKSTRNEDNAAIDGYLDGLARQLIASGAKVRIAGHTDFVGESKENHSFGLMRANTICDILVRKGVPKSQITCSSFGDTKPVATNDSPYGRYLNRRVEIRVAQ